MSEQPENLDNPATPDADGDGSLDDIQPGAQPNEAHDAGYLADDGPATSDPDHGIPGDAEALPEWDADTDGDDTPDEDDDDLADDEPEEVDETVTDDEGTPSELDEDPDGE